jgi:hypothetical protein
MITIAKSENSGYFTIDDVPYPKNQYLINYDNISLGLEGMNFSLCSIYDGSKILSSRGYAEIEGLSNWGDLLTLLSKLKILASNDTNAQDQDSPPFDFFFTQIKGAPTTIAVETVIDEYTVTVADGSACGIGDYFGMFNALNPNDNRYSFSTILGISTNVLTLDTPVDFAFKIGDTAACFTRDMNVDGSVTPQVFRIQVGSAATQSIDITRIMISMLTASPVSLAKFGDIDPSLIIRGLVLRRTNGDVRNIWNAKSNGEIANLTFDYDPYTALNPAQGQDGAKFRYTLAGQAKHGVVVRLHPGDSLDLIVQDPLQTLVQFRVIGEGHVVLL